MPWWGWIIIGAVLFGAEIMGIDAAFFLIFIGISALLVGLADLLGMDLPAWGEFLLFAVIAVLSMVFFRQRIYTMVRSNAKGVANTLPGETVKVTADIAPGESGRVAHRGSTWSAVNVSDATLRAGSQATIQGVDGATLKIS